MLFKPYFHIAVCVTLQLFQPSCKKSADGLSSSPGETGTSVINPQVDVAVLKSQGFFLTDWAARSFTVPIYTDSSGATATATTTITVDYSRVITKVSKYLFGNNANIYMGQLVTEPVLLGQVKDLSPNIIRFPGGNISSLYFWNATTKTLPADIPASLYDSNGNPVKDYYWAGNNTDSWTLSLDNYYAALAQTRSTGIITINYSYARYGLSAHPDQVAAHLAADWVRYDKGRTRYWEIGNESFGVWEAGWQIDTTKNKDGQPRIITGVLYGTHFKVFADSMRRAALETGAKIEIGAQLMSVNPAGTYDSKNTGWNPGIFSAAGDSPDYYIVHDYFTDETTRDIPAILNTPIAESKKIMDWMNASTLQGNAALKPVALTEWNIFTTGAKQMVSAIAGIHATLVLGEVIKNKFGMACRWDLANGWQGGDDMGMFSLGDEPDNTARWNPRPAFYYMYLFQKCFGDRMVSSEVTGNPDVLAYASSFSSGEAGIVLVNKGTAAETVSIDIQNFHSGSRYYYYTLVGGSDNGGFSRKVFINGQGPAGPSGGPAGYRTLKANSALFTGNIRIAAPARSVIFLVAESKQPN